jgi:hypothetical protein
MGELQSELIENFLLQSLHPPFISVAAAVLQAVQPFALAGGKHQFFPNSVNSMTGGFERGGAFFDSQFEDVAPGPGTQEFVAGDTGGQFVAQTSPAFGEFDAGLLDLRGGLFTGSKRPGVALARGLLGLFSQGEYRLQGKPEWFHRLLDSSEHRSEWLSDSHGLGWAYGRLHYGIRTGHGFGEQRPALVHGKTIGDILSEESV